MVSNVETRIGMICKNFDINSGLSNDEVFKVEKIMQEMDAYI
jgi:hypothetical protein